MTSNSKFIYLSPGLLTAVHRDYFRILNYQDLLFNDFGDRVAQLLHVESVVPFNQSQNSSVGQQMLIVNTHLLFPHDSSLCILRLQQVNLSAFLQIYSPLILPAYSVSNFSLLPFHFY